MSRPSFIRILISFVLTAGALEAGEFRALWADAFHEGFYTPEQTTRLVADARRGNFNAIIVQVRKRGDAFYQSALEPKAVQVSPANYDPLADLIEKAHAGPEPLEVHAWIVTYNIWNRETTLPPQADHPFRLHPDWLTQRYFTGATWDGANHAFDPGHPEVQQHVFDVCMDLVNHYDIDGLHLDYIRYSESGSSANNNPWGYHPLAVARFNALNDRSGTPLPNDPLWLDFRRDQVTALVRKIYLNLLHQDPSVRLSAATIAWGRPPSSTSPSSFASTTPYSRVLQDWRGWMEEGILDLNILMNYRDQPTLGADFSVWCDRLQDLQFDRAAAVGLGAFLNTTADTIKQIRTATSPSPSGNSSVGVASYSYAVPNDDNNPRDSFLNALTSPSSQDSESVPVFESVASTPSMPWKTDPSMGHLMGTFTVAETGQPADGAKILISGPVTRELTADATGFFGAVDLPVGDYSLTASFDLFPDLNSTLLVTGASVTTLVSRFSNSPPVILSVGPNDLGGLTLEWTSGPDQRFTVQVSDDLVSWSNLAVRVRSKGQTTSYNDFTSGSRSHRYYRVIRTE